MINSIAQFESHWKQHADGTRKMMAELTDASLNQEVAQDHRTLGRIAWHITTSIVEMMERVGLKYDNLSKDAPVPMKAAEIKNAYDKAANLTLEQITKNWTDETLQIVDEMYGEKWSRGLTLQILMGHEIHHRGQMTILMRQAGLKVPGLMGPSYEEWPQYGMKPPEV